MSRARIEEIVRHFPQNGMKLLLQNPANVRDLLTVAGGRWARLIDFNRIRLVPATFVQRDFRHVESDVVLLAPLRRAEGSRTRTLLVYILIEHQSEPDRLMPLRLLEYVVAIFKYQEREWAKEHASFAGILLQP